MPPEHIGNRSAVVKKTGPDGSYQETVEAIANTGELESAGAAVERFDKVVAWKKPVKLGKEGRPVGREAVRRVFKFHFVKPTQPHLEVVKRVVKKKMESSPEQKAAPASSVERSAKVEPSIKDFGVLAEVLPKAA